MNRDQIFDMFHGTSDEFVADAIESRKIIRPTIRKNRIMLIAAVIAITILLVGCAAAYYWLQNMSIGVDSDTKFFDDQGHILDEPIDVQRQVLTFAGYSGSPTNMAASEWYTFRKNYDPEGKYMSNKADIPEIDNNYEYVYGCYTTEMADKLDEIVNQHGVNLLDESIPVQKWQSDIALESIGVSTLLTDGAEAAMSDVQGMLYPPYNFALKYYYTLTNPDATWSGKVRIGEYYHYKDYLPAIDAWYLDIANYEQWHYTTSDGIELLMALSTDGTGFIIAEQESAFLVVTIDGNNTGSAYPSPSDVPNKQSLEQMADTFNFSIRPQPFNVPAIRTALETADTEYKAEHTVPKYYGKPFADFNSVLQVSTFYWSQGWEYAFYDMNEDGVDDLLLGCNGMISCWYSAVDGVVEEIHIEPSFLCQDYILEKVDTMGDFSSYIQYTYCKMKNGIVVDTVPEKLTLFQGKWYLSTENLWIEDFATHPTITPEAANGIRSQYIHVDLIWNPVMEYPLNENGYSLKNYVEEIDVRLSDDDLRRAYAEMICNSGHDWYTHYRIIDVNGDEVEDLLLSMNGQFYSEGYTYRYGKIRSLFTEDIYLCEDGVMDSVDIRYEVSGIEIDEHRFFTMDVFQCDYLEYVAYNKATGQWIVNIDGISVSETEARNILRKYPHVEQGMQPIVELTGK